MSAPAPWVSLFRYKAWANEQTFAALRLMSPATQALDLQAATRLMNHTYVVDRIFAAHLTGVPHPYTGTNTTETPPLDELHAAVGISDRWYIDYLEKVQPALLGESIAFTFTDGKRGRMTREEMLAHVITHGGYHRGSVGRILTQAAVTPPRDIFTVFLHQDQPERRG